MLIPPPGILRPNRAAIDAGLSFAQAFQNGPSLPWLARDALADSTLALAGGGTIGVLQGGHGVTGNGGYWGGTSASNTYAMPTDEGTVIVAAVADHSPTDGLPHELFFFGSTAWPTGPAVEIVKWSSNEWHMGLISTTNKRLSFPASGTYSSGLVTVALTYSPAGQVAYINGIQRASNALSGLGDTSGAYALLGQNYVANRKWSSGTTGGVLYALVFDRALTAQEIARAEADLWWWCRQPAVRTVRRAANPPLTASIAAGTLSLTASATAEWDPATTAAGPSRRTRRGARRVYLPEQPSAVFHPSALPADLAPAAQPAWQEEDGEWLILA